MGHAAILRQQGICLKLKWNKYTTNFREMNSKFWIHWCVPSPKSIIVTKSPWLIEMKWNITITKYFIKCLNNVLIIPFNHRDSLPMAKCSCYVNLFTTTWNCINTKIWNLNLKKKIFSLNHTIPFKDCRKNLALIFIIGVTRSLQKRLTIFERTSRNWIDFKTL